MSIILYFDSINNFNNFDKASGSAVGTVIYHLRIQYLFSINILHLCSPCLQSRNFGFIFRLNVILLRKKCYHVLLIIRIDCSEGVAGFDLMYYVKINVKYCKNVNSS